MHMPVEPAANNKYNLTTPPDKLWLRFPEDKGGGVIKNKTFSYSFRGEIFKEDSEIDQKVYLVIALGDISLLFLKYDLNYVIPVCFIFTGYFWPGNIFQYYPATNHISRWLQFEKSKFLKFYLIPIYHHKFEMRAQTNNYSSGFVLQKYFFRNLGAILMYALIGTALSAFAIG